MRNDRQAGNIKCARCGKYYDKMQYGSGNVSSFSFPQYKIQRYKDFDSRPIEIDICNDCANELDRFFFIKETGIDYFKDEGDLISNE